MLGLFVQTVMLGPIPEALGDTCYLSPTLKEIVILVQITVWFSFLGYLRLNSWGKADICSCYTFGHFLP